MPRPPLPPAEPMELDSLAEVARGGMGSVELCRVLDGRLAGQMVAIKRLHANISEDPEFVAMFLDEAWITAALHHLNVAQVMAWGTDGKGPFLAIELVQGVSLSRLMKEAQSNQEPFAERTVAFICSQICAGLTAAHSLTAPDGTPMSVVHRDLTPANVLVSFDGVVKIIDFGIAKAEERITHTRTGQLKGKPSYMAPEQQRGTMTVDHRADLFAFGVTMFELLAGRRPWAAKGAFDVMMEIANDPHPDLGELRKGLNPEFVAIAHKCLEKKPENRFNSAQEIKQRLDAWLASKGFAADDQHSLAQFIARNSQPQIKWWEEALRGEHAKKKAPTFKELEEKIDEEREKRDKPRRPPPLRPAAGAPALSTTTPMQPRPEVARSAPRMSGTVPMPQYKGPLSVQGPASERSAPASSGPMSPPVSSGPMSSGPMSPPVSSGPMSGGPMSPPVSSGQHAHAYPYAPPQQAASGQQVSQVVPSPQQASQIMATPQGAPHGHASQITPAPHAPQHGHAPQSAPPQHGYPSQIMAAPQGAQHGYPSPIAAAPQAAQQAPSSQVMATPLSQLAGGGGGTEYLGVSPFAGQPSPSAPPQPTHPPDQGSHPLSQRWGQPQAPQSQAPLGTESGTLPMSTAIPVRPLPTGSMLAAAGVSPATAAALSPGPASSPEPASAAPPPATVPPKRSRLGLVLLLVAIPLVGAAVSAWIFRDQLAGVGTSGATDRAPPPKATGRAR